MPKRRLCTFSLCLGTLIFFLNEKLWEKNLRKLNCSYVKVPYTFKKNLKRITIYNLYK